MKTDQSETTGPARPDGQERSICSTATRQTARGVLRTKIENVENELRELRVLERALPLELPHEADAALWRLLVQR